MPEVRSTLYIAGPFRGDPRTNTAKAVAWGAHYTALGHPCIVPHLISRDLDPLNRMGDDWWLSATLKLMETCDEVVLTPGWYESEGCLAEMRRACELGLPIRVVVPHGA